MKDHERDEISLNPVVPLGVQLRTLHAVCLQVQRCVVMGQRPIVEIDVDLTAAMPIYRTRQALIVAGEEARIDMFLNPESLPVLPGYSDEAWMAFVSQCNLEQKYPHVSWRDESGGPNKLANSAFSVFHAAYWSTEAMAEDKPTPGLGSFVHRVRQLGGEVVFISGRWLEQHINPTLLMLARAGISEPKLVIGNHRHPTLVSQSLALSDAQIKVLHQKEVRKAGEPIAVIDDRIANRTAIIQQSGNTLIGVGVCIPGFTYDPVTNLEPLRISTFETFDNVITDPPARPYLLDRYPKLGLGVPWRGLYEGLGHNNRAYVLPRVYSSKYWEVNQVNLLFPFKQLLSQCTPGSLHEEEFIRLCSSTIPSDEITKLEKCLEDAERLATAGIAASYPQTDHNRILLRLSLIATWLHSRDIEQLMTAIGYPLFAQGKHDLEEYVQGGSIQEEVARKVSSGAQYSDWMLRWATSLEEDTCINIGVLNPSLIVSMWHWTPTSSIQDAMDVHRLSSHHLGDMQERYDPIEAAINNVLHQREGLLGIRKEPVVSWEELREISDTETQAEKVGKNSVSRDALRDAIDCGTKLEGCGALTPWELVRDCRLQVNGSIDPT